MYFEDLSLCDYHSGPYASSSWSAPLLAIGWLEHPHSFSKGDTSHELIQRLEEFTDASRKCYPSYCFRGVHQCSHCLLGERGDPRSVQTHVNLWIPGEWGVYIAPALIIHYIGDHGYHPPDEFIAAVMRCPEYGSPSYCDALQAANVGIPPPLKPKDQVDAEFKEELERALALRSMCGTPPGTGI